MLLLAQGVYKVISPFEFEKITKITEITPTRVLLHGWVVSLPVQKHHGAALQFDFKTQLGLLNCSWYGLYPYKLIPGTEWSLEAKVTPWFRVRNFPDFNDQHYLLSHGYAGICVILRSLNNQYLGVNFWVDQVDQYRAKLKTKLLKITQNMTYQRFILGLMLGERSGFSDSDWAVLRNTGTNHLFAIAGLHIGVMAWLSFWVSWCCLIISKRLCEIGWVPILSLLFSWGVIFLYSALAGFSIPTERALIMVSVFMLFKLAGYRVNPYVSWGIALWILLSFNPFVIFDATTWLSFIAVFFLIYGYRQYQPKSMLGHLCYAQWVIFIGLLPISLTWFSQVSWVAFGVNLIAVPYLSFIIMPCVFLSFFGFKFIFILNNFLISLLWGFLKFASDWPYSHEVLKTPSILSVMLATLGGMILLKLDWRHWRWLGLILILPILI